MSETAKAPHKITLISRRRHRPRSLLRRRSDPRSCRRQNQLRLRLAHPQRRRRRLRRHRRVHPQSPLRLHRANKVALKGPVTTPIGGGFASINVTLRKKFDLYANFRPIKNLPGLKTNYPGVDLVIFRENTEDLYAGLEVMVVPGVAQSLKIITEKGSTRIAKAAFEYARKHGRKKIHSIHKANIMKLTDGLFLECARKVAAGFPEIEYKEHIVDNTCMQLVMNPYQYDILLTSNLYGDILSDLCSAFVGGLGLVPGANLGVKAAIFEAVHGSAPDIAGQDKANPTALLQSAILMLHHLDETATANLVQKRPRSTSTPKAKPSPPTSAAPAAPRPSPKPSSPPSTDSQLANSKLETHEVRTRLPPPETLVILSEGTCPIRRTFAPTHEEESRHPERRPLPAPSARAAVEGPRTLSNPAKPPQAFSPGLHLQQLPSS